MAEHCQFDTFYDTVLRGSDVKAKVLNEAKDAKFEEVVRLAVSFEMVQQNVSKMNRQRSEIHCF
jgi:regulatory protein YycH of two-component signal transduction system YycFG